MHAASPFADVASVASSPLGHVLVVGSLNLDLMVQAPHLPAPGETLTGRDFRTDQGGKGANQAVAAARLGAPVAMLGCVGDDDAGRRLRAGLQADGIDVSAVRTVPGGVPTGTAVITVADDGENCIVVIPGTNAHVGAADVDAVTSDLLRTAALLVLQLEIPLVTVRHALRTARALGVTTLLNVAPAVPLTNDDLACVDWLVVNEGEAALLAGLSVSDVSSAGAAALALQARGAAQVLVTLGSAGVLHAGPDGALQHWPAPKVQAVDTTGAGDTFVGAFAAGLVAADAQALPRALGAAALQVTRHGTQSAMPTQAELDAFLADRAA
jgi:ribokinase